jgi:sec-independent protein translocase protein TatB
VFGLGFGEMLLILIVGIVVVGPRQLPTLMRTAGQWISKLRRMSTDLRSQSGIDDLIRQEGLEKEIQELRALSRVNVIDTLVSASTAPPRAKPPPRQDPKQPAPLPGSEPLREREYPLLGCDHYDVLADDVLPYVEPVEEADEPAAEGSAAGAAGGIAS